MLLFSSKIKFNVFIQLEIPIHCTVLKAAYFMRKPNDEHLGPGLWVWITIPNDVKKLNVGYDERS